MEKITILTQFKVKNHSWKNKLLCLPNQHLYKNDRSTNFNLSLPYEIFVISGKPDIKLAQLILLLLKCDYIIHQRVPRTK